MLGYGMISSVICITISNNSTKKIVLYFQKDMMNLTIPNIIFLLFENLSVQFLTSDFSFGEFYHS